jgi:FMN-dependent NADH-azoreductase
MRILHINANPKPTAEAASRQLTAAFFQALTEAAPDVEVTTRDLYADPPPFYDYATYRHFWYPVFIPDYQPTPEEVAAVAYARAATAQVNAADVLVITAPMWNFGVPAILKAWLDQIIQPGITFSMGAGGVQPLHHLQKVIIFTASGGAYAPGDPRDHAVPALRAAVGFLGVKEVDVAWADGQNLFFFADHAERKATAVANAQALAQALVRVPAGL